MGFPAGDEVRVGVGSFDPRVHVKEPTVALAERPRAAEPSATRATGSRTGCAAPTEDGVFFVGDSAGHCLPTTAEGIRTALYFGLACGRELRAGRRGPPDARAGARALRARSPRTTAAAFDWLLRVQTLVGGVNACRDGPALKLHDGRRFVRWLHGYLDIAPPSFAAAPHLRLEPWRPAAPPR